VGSKLRVGSIPIKKKSTTSPNNIMCPLDDNSVNDIKKQIVNNVFEKVVKQPYNNNVNKDTKIACLKKMLSAKNTSKLNNRTKKLNLKGMEKIALRKAIEEHSLKKDEHSLIKGENNIKYKLAKLGVLDTLSEF
jgi:hypothetical protein